MRAELYVRTQLPGSYVISPCTGKFVVKFADREIGARGVTKRRAWANAKRCIQNANKHRYVKDRKSIAAGDR